MTVLDRGLGERGQALAEFALVLPLLLLLVAGILEFGRAWNIKQAVTDAGREGARYAVVKDSSVATVEQVKEKIRERLALAHISTAPGTTTIDLSPMTNFRVPGEEMTVTITTKYRMGLLGAFLKWTTGASTVTIGTQTTMRNE